MTGNTGETLAPRAKRNQQCKVYNRSHDCCDRVIRFPLATTRNRLQDAVLILVRPLPSRLGLSYPAERRRLDAHDCRIACAWKTTSLRGSLIQNRARAKVIVHVKARSLNTSTRGWRAVRRYCQLPWYVVPRSRHPGRWTRVFCGGSRLPRE